MKKILLGLFLILGVVSFAAPEYVDVKGMEKSGYIISGNKKDSLLAFKLTQKDRISAMEFLDESENNRAYIQRFKGENEGLYLYNIVAKNQKVNGCYVTIFFSEEKELSEENLNEKIDSLLNEVESFLK